MKISYLINQYPKVSHSFIRREILALERQGLIVQRIAQRGWQDQLADKEDIQEREKTGYIVKQGAFALFWATLKMVFAAPGRFFSMLTLACRMSKNSDRSIIYHLIYFAEACLIVPWLKQHQSQHLHAHFGTNSAEIAMLASGLSGIPYSFTVHGPEEFDKPIMLGLGTKIRYAKFVVAVSSFGRSQLYRWCEYLHWPKIKEVHCGIESAFYDVHATPLPSALNLVCVGRICEQKGQLLLVEAAKQLADRGIDFQLTLAGDGEMRAEVERLINTYRLGERIKITGWIDSHEVRRLILSARAMVLPSFAEGLPVVIMEAMTLRRPVISTYIAGIPELVKHGENGWLCPAGEVDMLAETMAAALASSDETLIKMGERARNDAISRHHIDQEAAKLAAHFKG